MGAMVIRTALTVADTVATTAVTEIPIRTVAIMVDTHIRKITETLTMPDIRMEYALTRIAIAMKIAISM